MRFLHDPPEHFHPGFMAAGSSLASLEEVIGQERNVCLESFGAEFGSSLCSRGSGDEHTAQKRGSDDESLDSGHASKHIARVSSIIRPSFSRTRARRR